MSRSRCATCLSTHSRVCALVHSNVQTLARTFVYANVRTRGPLCACSYAGLHGVQGGGLWDGWTDIPSLCGPVNGRVRSMALVIMALACKNRCCIGTGEGGAQ